MSTVFLHVGQCGNQIGQEFWSQLAWHADQDFNTKHAFWTHGGPGRDKHGHARGVFADSEKKVLFSLLNKARKLRKTSKTGLRFGFGNLVSSATGCGSNWAMGHNRLPQQKIVNPWPVNTYSYSHELDYGEDDSTLKATMEAVRREVEACDCFSGFVSFHSLGGGTGSGYGSRVSAELRERYPVAYQMNVVVAPHSTGDSPTQPYNELLCLSQLQQNSDAIVIFENDEVLDYLSRSTSNKHNSVSYEQMNSYISTCMVDLLRPVSSLTSPKGVTVGIEPWELIRSVAPMHNLKLLQCRYVNESSSTKAGSITWDKLGNVLCQQLKTKALKNDPAKNKDMAISAVCVCRNELKKQDRKPGTDLDVAKLASRIKMTTNCVQWNPFPVDVWIDEAKSIKNAEKCIAFCSNSSSLATVHCARVLRSADIKFRAGAYLHWYERYGTQVSDFEEAFETVHGIVEEYKSFVTI